MKKRVDRRNRKMEKFDTSVPSQNYEINHDYDESRVAIVGLEILYAHHQQEETLPGLDDNISLSDNSAMISFLDGLFQSDDSSVARYGIGDDDSLELARRRGLTKVKRKITRRRRSSSESSSNDLVDTISQMKNKENLKDSESLQSETIAYWIPLRTDIDPNPRSSCFVSVKNSESTAGGRVLVAGPGLATSKHMRINNTAAFVSESNGYELLG
jgi:hypothetical protein